MKQFFKGKIFLQAICVSVLFSLISMVPLSCQMVSNSVSQLTGDGYYASALSFVQDKDLNIANNLPAEAAWKLTRTRNIAGEPDAMGGLPWIPFHAYAQMILGPLDLQPDNCLVSNWQVAHILGNIFYLFAFFALLFWLLKNLGFTRDLKWIVVLSFCATPRVLFSTLQSTGNVLQVLVLLMLQICLMSEHASGRKEILKWFLIGAIGGLAFVFEKHIFYFTIAPILFVFFREPINKKTFAWVGLVFVGWLSVYTIDLINYDLKHGNIKNPIFPIALFDLSRYFIEEPDAMTRSLFGPNGIFYLFPIYAISFLGIAKFIVDTVERAKRLNANEALIMSVAITGLASLFYNPRLYFFKEQIGSGHFISQQTLLTMGLALFLTYIGDKQRKFLKPVLCVLSAWSFMWVVAYINRDRTFGIIFQNYNWEFWRGHFSFIKYETLDVFSRIYLPRLAFDVALLWFPFALMGAMIFHWIKMKNNSVRVILSLMLIVGFLGVTAVNRIYEKENTYESIKAGTFKNRVIAYSYFLFAYDEYMSILEYLQRYFEMHGPPEQLRKLIFNRTEWAKKVNDAIIFDGIHFKDNFAAGIIKPPFKGIYSAHEAEGPIQCPAEK